MTTAMQMSPGRRCRACVALEIARNCCTDYLAAERGPLLYSLVVTAVFSDLGHRCGQLLSVKTKPNAALLLTALT